MPVTNNRAYAVIFSGLGFSPAQIVTNVSTNSVKLDFVRLYAGPVVAGSSTPYLNTTNVYTASTIGGATSYEWKISRLVPFAYVEGAENGVTTNISVVSSAGYSVIANDVKVNGASSLHLAHMNPSATQSVIFAQTFSANSNSALTFFSRLGTATSNQTARVQVSTDGGVSWQDICTRAGSGAPGQTSFTRYTNSLAAFAGREIRLRFAYTAGTGSYNVGAGTGTGWYLDDIQFRNTDQSI